MSSQKALVLPTKFGEWTVSDIPMPEPGPKQVLIKIGAAALNPADWKTRKFGGFTDVYPTIAGLDAAGVVEKVGAEVTNLKVGDRVFYSDFATFRQYNVMDEDFVGKIPDNISLEEASSVALGFFTAALALYASTSAGFTPPWEDDGASSKNKSALILGGASSVGRSAIQLAKLSGRSPIIASVSAHNAELVTSLGATHVLPRTLSKAEALEQLSAITAGAPLLYVHDAIGSPDTIALGYEALAPGGTLVTVNPNAPIVKAAPVDGKRAVAVYASVFRPSHRALGVEMYKRLPGWLESGVIRPNQVEVLPGGLAGIPAGLARLEAGEVSGTKLVVRPHETA